MKKSVVSLSGGQDSSTTLAQAAVDSTVVGGIYFDYGQRHRIEESAARFFANHYQIPLEVVHVTAFQELGNSGLVGDAGDIHGAHPTLKHLPASFVPGRNLVFMTLASAYAMRMGATQVWTGVCQTDFSGYPDCRRDTMDALETSIRLGMDFPELEIVTPLMFEDKAETFARAKTLGVLDVVLEHSHTCYEGDHTTRHDWGYGCGVCPACKLRAQGWATYNARYS
jgi:7-cyano-7-deazaguanine synthase